MKKTLLAVQCMIIGLFSSATIEASLALEKQPVAAPLKVWASPKGGYFKDAQYVKLETNYDADTLLKKQVKIFYTFDLNGSLDDIYEYEEPIFISNDQEQDIWFFAFTSPENETRIQYEKYSFVDLKKNLHSAPFTEKNTMYITEVAPRTPLTQSDWIEVKNYGDKEYRIAGWYIKTRKEEVYLPEMIVQPGGVFTVHLPLHNFHDHIKLFDGQDNLIDEAQYKQIVMFDQSLGKKEFWNAKGCFKPLYNTAYPTKGAPNAFPLKIEN